MFALSTITFVFDVMRETVERSVTFDLISWLM